MKFKKRKKNELGYFQTIGYTDPKANMKMFNAMMGSGDPPTKADMDMSSGEGMGEELTEAQQKNIYEITYIDSNDNSTRAYIEAYSEKQAALILRKETRVYRIVNIDCVEDHSKDDGEQLSLFETKSLTNISKTDKMILFAYLNSANTEGSQKSLRAYLCRNRLNKEDDPSLVVHHIDADHSNYLDSNLVLMTNGNHSKIHNEARTFAINTMLNNKGLSTKEDRDIFDAYTDLTKEDVNILINAYKARLKELSEEHKAG